MKVLKDGRVSKGVGCPGSIEREGQRTGCSRRAVHVVEDRTKYKCDYGHRWPRNIGAEEERSIP